MTYVNKPFLFTLSLIIFLGMGTSCKKDSCDPPEVSENIIGNWKAKNTENYVEFKNDGTYTDDNEYLYGVSIGGINYSDRTYAISGDTLKLTVSDPAGSGSSTKNYMIDANKCQEIVISTSLGITITTTLEKQ